MSADDLPESASEALDADSADMPDDADMGDPETPNEPWRPRHHGANEPRGPDYRPFTGKFDEDRRGGGSVRAGGARALRSYLDKQLAPAGRGGASRQSPAAPPVGPAEPRLGVRPRRGLLDPARLRVIVDPLHPCRSSARRTPLPRHCGDAAARQSGSMRGRPITVAATCADILARARSSAAASRWRSSASPRGPGRADSRAAGSLPASRRIPAASMICATSSTRRPTRRGGARARISA